MGFKYNLKKNKSAANRGDRPPDKLRGEPLTPPIRKLSGGLEYGGSLRVNIIALYTNYTFVVVYNKDSKLEV